MCGIFGIINKDGSKVPRDLVQTATQKLAHRGPDDEGFLSLNNIGLGHKRLSIIDLSENARQPFNKHKLSIIYNGEIYNHDSIREELVILGYTFTSNSDTEVLLSGFDCWGEEVFEKLNGMWALAIFDHKTKRTLLSRDRYGMKPLYIYQTASKFCFASEIKAFSVLSEWTGELNTDIAHDFLANALLHHKMNSFYKDVIMLDAASYCWISDLGEIEHQSSYFEIQNEHLEGNVDQLTVQYQELFSKAVKAHYISDVPVASALSGGLDSSSIVAASMKDRKVLDTFSFAPIEKKYNEYEYVQSLQEKYEFKNHCISPDFETHISAHKATISSCESPTLNINFVSSFLLYQKVAAENYKVLLAGQGADELLLGYSFYYGPFLRQLLKTNKWLFLKEALAIIYHYPLKSIRIMRRAFKTTSYNRFIIDRREGESETQVISDYNSFYKDQLGYGHLHALLQFEDRLSMAHSVEGRLPFLDKDFSIFLHSLAPTLKIKNGVRKHIMRKAMAEILPKKILQRKDKMGYSTPQDLWMTQNKQQIISSIAEGQKKHANWLGPEVNGFVENALDKGKDLNFVWRVYSFYIFLDVKL